MSTNQYPPSQYDLHQCLEHETAYEIWKAFDTQQHRYVTIQILHVGSPGTTTLLHFQQEALLLLSLQHPNIVQIFDSLILQTPGSSDTDIWIVMDYLEGISLAAYIQTVTQQNTVPPPAEVVRFLAGVGSAIDYAHRQNVIHGHITLTNILLDKHSTSSSLLGEPHLIGFGMHGLQNPLTLPLHEVAYISPEVACAQPANARSDVYSLGVILYQVCTGSLPFQGQSTADLIQQHIAVAPAAPATLNPHIPPLLTAVILTALAKDPMARFSTATALITATAQALDIKIPAHASRPDLSLDNPANSPTVRSTPASRSGLTPHPGISSENKQAMPYTTPPPTTLTSFPNPSAPGIANISAVPANTLITPPGSSSPNYASVTPGPNSGAWAANQMHYAQPISSQPFTPPAVINTPASGQQTRRNTYIVVSVLLTLLIILAGSLTTFFLLARPSTKVLLPSASSIVGHAFFVSSGQVSTSSDVGIADEMQITLQNIQPAAAGKAYYVWLLSDNKTEALPLGLGPLTVQNGQAVMTYSGDARHSDILASYSHFLITEEDATVPPINYTLDKGAWRFGAAFSATPNPTDTVNHFSLLDHVRHLLAQDPKLQKVGLVGGLDIWLFRNTQKILEWAGSARDSQDTGLIQRQLVRILDYLDGSQFVLTEPIPAGMSPIETNPKIARVALLEIDPQQEPPGYLTHIGNHLRELNISPGVSSDQQALAVRITQAINNVQLWLAAVHKDAEILIKTPQDQLLQPAASSTLNDMFTQANNAFIGQTDPNTLQTKEGVAQIHYNIQRLATFDITPCATNQTVCG